MTQDDDAYFFPRTMNLGNEDSHDFEISAYGCVIVQLAGQD